MTVHASRIEVSARVPGIAGASKSKKVGVYRAGVKRLFDLVAVLVALPFLAPFYAIVAAMIAADGHSPIFRQERVGKDGRRFMMLKFRTMVPDAEAKLEAHLSANPEAQIEWNSKQKLADDPRVTKLGALLRRTSIDELPQLINVLKGDMSLVGPRPMMPCQQALYPGHAYYNLRPGVTGPWQVSERSKGAFADRAHFDDIYDLSLSFFGDMKLLLKTVLVVFRGTGV